MIRDFYRFNFFTLDMFVNGTLILAHYLSVIRYTNHPQTLRALVQNMQRRGTV